MFYRGKLLEFIDLWIIICGLWFVGLLTRVACVNPSPTGINRYEENSTTAMSSSPHPTSQSSEESILPPPPPSYDDCPAIFLIPYHPGHSVKWPASNYSDNLITSSPQCLDHFWQLRVKQCVKNIGWQPAQTICDEIEIDYESADKCPDGYFHLTEDICIMMHPKQSFRSDSCDDNLLPFTIYNLTKVELVALFTYLRNYGPYERFWLPAKQTNNNINGSLQIGFRYTVDEVGVQWTIPAFFGEIVTLHDDSPTCTFEDHGGCLSFSPTLNSDNRFNSSVVNCNTHHLHSFCIFRKNETLHRLACPEGYMASLIPKSKNVECSAIHRFDPLPVTNVSDELVNQHCHKDVYELNSVATTFNFELLAKQSNLLSDDRCLFGITPFEIVVNSSIFIDLFVEKRICSFVNWDASMGLHDFNFSSNAILSVNEHGKWFWESTRIMCIACAENISFRWPRIELKYNSNEVKLRLTVVNAEFLLPRFTNNLPFMCFAKVHNQYSHNLGATLIASDSDGTVYDVKLIGPGNYWCIGHAIKEGNQIQTETVFAQGIVMSMTVEFDCRLAECDNSENVFKSFLYSCELDKSAIIDPAHIQIEEVSTIATEFPPGVEFARIIYHVTVRIENEEALRNEKNELKLSEEMLTYYYIRQKFVQISNLQNVSLHCHNQFIENLNFRIRSVNSTNFCLPSSISTLTDINWLGAEIGHTVLSVERCFDVNGLPMQRKCVGDTIYGAEWLRLSSERECLREDSSDLTGDLKDLVDSFNDPEQTGDIIENVRHLVSNSSDRLVRMDIFFVSQIIGRATSFLDQRKFSAEELQNLVVIYNNLMQVNQNVARSSAAFNSTNVLLNSLDLIFLHEAYGLFAEPGNVSQRNPSTDFSRMSESFSDGDAAVTVQLPGVIVNVSPMLINIVIDPKLTNASGVAVSKRIKHSRFGFDAKGLMDYSLQYLQGNQSWDDLLLQPDLQVASFLPNDLLRDILVTNPDAKLVFSIFYNDVLFQTFDNATYIKSDGKIIAVSVPGLKELPSLLPIFVKPEESINEYCGYWDFNNRDGWSETGCFRLAQNPSTKIVLCACNHLTHFAYLLKGNSSHFEEVHLRSLEGITVLGCILSLVGIIGIYVTAIQFRSWRSKASTKFLLQLSTAIAFQMILLAFVNTASITQKLLLTNNEAWCIVIGVLLHYFVLAMFFWMLIIAYLQFIRYVIVFNHIKTPRFLLKSSLLGWTLPMIPVLLVVLIDRGTYVPDLKFSESQICYPSGYSLYFGILLPIGVIVGANLVIFILVNYNLLRGTNAVFKAGDRNTKLSQLRLSIFLFFLLGLTWIFGLISTAFAETSIVFSYLFCLTSTLQGFVMFLYFVILDPVARHLWVYFFKRLCCSKKGNIDIRKENSSKDSY